MTIKELEEAIRATIVYYMQQNSGRWPDAVPVDHEQFDLWCRESPEMEYQLLGSRSPIQARGLPLIVVMPQTITPGLHNGPRVITPLAVGTGRDSEGLFELSS